MQQPSRAMTLVLLLLGSASNSGRAFSCRQRMRRAASAFTQQQGTTTTAAAFQRRRAKLYGGVGKVYPLVTTLEKEDEKQPGAAEDGDASSSSSFDTVTALRAYRQQRRTSLLDVAQIKDDRLRAALSEGEEWRGAFAAPGTLANAVSLFMSYSTPRFIVAMLGVSIAARCCLAASAAAPLAIVDAAWAVAVAAFWVVQEWVLHDKLLHSDFEWFGKDIHQLHHDLPYYHVSLDGLQLAMAWFTVAALAAVCVTPSLALAATATATYTAMGLWYEFTHFISHTRTPLPPPLAATRRHHMSHHLVSSSHWLAFTVPAVDRLFGTLPENGARSIRADQRNNYRPRPQQKRP